MKDTHVPHQVVVSSLTAQVLTTINTDAVDRNPSITVGSSLKPLSNLLAGSTQESAIPLSMPHYMLVSSLVPPSRRGMLQSSSILLIRFIKHSGTDWPRNTKQLSNIAGISQSFL
jgi:hypothetical protein